MEETGLPVVAIEGVVSMEVKERQRLRVGEMEIVVLEGETVGLGLCLILNQSLEEASWQLADIFSDNFNKLS